MNRDCTYPVIAAAQLYGRSFLLMDYDHNLTVGLREVVAI